MGWFLVFSVLVCDWQMRSLHYTLGPLCTPLRLCTPLLLTPSLETLCFSHALHHVSTAICLGLIVWAPGMCMHTQTQNEEEEEEQEDGGGRGGR